MKQCLSWERPLAMTWKRYDQESLCELLNIASVFDPRFKTLPHLANHPGLYPDIKQGFKLKAATERP